MNKSKQKCYYKRKKMKIEKRMPDLLNIVTHWNRRRKNPKHTNIARSIQISKFGEIIQ